MVVKTATYVPLESFEEKQFFLNWTWLQTSSDFEMKKIGILVKKTFFRVITTGIRASRGMFWGKMISLSKEVLFFCYHFWSLSDFFVFFAKFFSQVCQTTDQRAERNKMGKLPWKNCFFNQFWIWGKKIWFFSKTVRHGSQNRSPPVQLTIFRNFSGSKIICMKIFGHWTETSDFPRKCFLRVVKGAFQVFSATLWEKDDKGKL